MEKRPGLEIGRAKTPLDLLAGVDLVIFDFDGVVVDSEDMSLTTLRAALAEFGVPMSHEEVRQAFLGKSLASIVAHLEAHGAAGHADVFVERWQTTLFDAFRAELKPMAGLQAMLDTLAHRGVHHCIASSGSVARLDVALRAAGLRALFAHVFSAEHVQHGKPAPDLFLHAAGTLGVAPEACLVIEDSPSGVRAAKTAGMRCIGFLGGGHLHAIRQQHGEHLIALGAERVALAFADIV
ncbi:MAG: HAD family phosphatase [Pseudomonadota bacterium]